VSVRVGKAELVIALEVGQPLPAVGERLRLRLSPHAVTVLPEAPPDD